LDVSVDKAKGDCHMIIMISYLCKCSCEHTFNKMHIEHDLQ